MKKFFYCLWAFVFLLGGTVFAQETQDVAPMSESVNLVQSVQSVNVTPTMDWDLIHQEDALSDLTKGEAPWRWSVPMSVSYNTENHGSWTTLANGDRIWRLRIASEGALRTGLTYDNFYLPEGATLHLYNDDKSYIRGAYDSKANPKTGTATVTPFVRGEAVTLEYYEPAAVAGEGIISIDNVYHHYRGGVEELFAGLRADPCQVDVACRPEGNNWQDEKNSVVMLDLGGGLCTGSMVTIQQWIVHQWS
jgi:hypothetical protein